MKDEYWILGYEEAKKDIIKIIEEYGIEINRNNLIEEIEQRLDISEVGLRK